MKHLLYLFILIFSNSNAFTSSNNDFIISEKDQEVLSPISERVLRYWERYNFSADSLFNSEIGAYLCLQKLDNNIYISALAKVDLKSYDKNILLENEVIVGSQTADIISLRIPLEKLLEVSRLPFFKKLNADFPADANLDKNREQASFSYLFADNPPIHSKYRAKDVIIGIIDIGFDFSHPEFYDRIRRIWIQNVDISFKEYAPVKYQYGFEIKDMNFRDGITVWTDYEDENHGQHVLGIAASNGKQTNGKFISPASESELVLVSNKYPNSIINFASKSFIADGLRYIMDYANEVNKPCVVNISLGNHLGPHDGTDLFDQVIDSLLKDKARAVVVAAGNSAGTPNHITKSFTGKIDSLCFNPYFFIIDDTGTNIIDIWGDIGQDFEVAVHYIGTSQDRNFYNEYISTKKFSKTVSTYDDENDVKSDAHYFVRQNNENGKKRILLEIIHKIPQTYCIISVRTNQKGTIHAWNCGVGGSMAADFNSIDYIEPYKFDIKPDNEYQIGEIGGNSKSAITVGAYCGNSQYIGANGKYNDLTTFTSQGPSSDNRIKPDICAPGSYIASSLNSFAALNYEDHLVEYKSNSNGKFYWYGAMSGTSMAAPFVTSAVALLLDANPDLSAEQCREILQSTAKTDSFTSDIPYLKNMAWGYGKLNIEEAVKLAKELSTALEDELLVYPNPCQNELYIRKMPGANTAQIEIFDILGFRLYNNQLTYSDVTGDFARINVSHLRNGVYFIKLSNEAGSKVSKIVINH